jgi:hypothetical protein
MVQAVAPDERLHAYAPGAINHGDRNHAVGNGKKDKGVVHSCQYDRDSSVSMRKPFPTASRVWYALFGMICHVHVILKQERRHSPPVIPSMIRMLTPAMANQMIPKKAVIYLE